MNFGKYIFTVLFKTEYDKRVICQARNVVAVTEEAEEAATQSISQGECLKNIIMNSYLYCEDCELLPEILDEVFVVCISCFAMEYDLSEQDYQICEASGRILYPPINNFYMNSEKTFGFIHNRVDTQLLPDSLRTSLTQLTEAEEFTGNRYYFFRIGNTSFAYRAQPFEAIKEFIAQINESIGLWVTIDGYKISKNGEWAVVEIRDGIFIIKREEDYRAAVEIEKASLSYGLHQSMPFFRLSPDKVDWAKLKPEHGHTFEALCELILRNDNRFVIVPRGKTNSPDGGRDFEAEESLNGQKIKWAVQCKFSRRKSISIKQIADWFGNLAEPDINGYWLMTNNDVSPGITDRFKKTAEKFPNIRTRIWQRTDFDNLKEKNPQLFNSDFFEQ